jgi:hypothetical protein
VPAIPALGRLRQEDHKFRASLDHVVLDYLGLHGETLSQKQKQGTLLDFVFPVLISCFLRLPICIDSKNFRTGRDFRSNSVLHNTYEKYFFLLSRTFQF